MEPIQVGRGRAVFQRVIELAEAAAGVIEHAVEHDADAARVRLVEQSAQRGVAAQDRIDGEIVVRVIAMIGRRGKDRD